MTTWELIRLERIKAGLTQQELAEKIGITGSAIAQWETNKRNPKYKTLQKISSALDIPVSALIADNEPESLSVGQRIKQERVNAGITQKDLGQKMGVSFQTVAQWENDLRNPKYETLEKIANALNTSVDYLKGKQLSQEAPNVKQCFSRAQFQIIKSLAQVAIENHLNPRPSAFVPTKEQVEILKSIISQIE